MSTPKFDYQTLAPVINGARLNIVFNRPDRRNALTHQMMVELTHLLEWTAEQTTVRVVVLSGAGGNFSAGGDLDAMRNLPPIDADGADPLVPAYRQMGEALERLDALPQVVISSVEGAAAGGGLGMACCADFVVATRTAKFGMPEAKWGFIPSQILPFIIARIGTGAARAMVATGRIADGSAAHTLGIVHELADDPIDLVSRTDRAVADALLNAPQAYSAAKELIRSSATVSRETLLDNAAARLVHLLRRPEAAEGIAAFLGKRKPRWTSEK